MFGEVARDPVCGLNVDESKAKAAGFQATYKNQAYYFAPQDAKSILKKIPSAMPQNQAGPRRLPAVRPVTRDRKLRP